MYLMHFTPIGWNNIQFHDSWCNVYVQRDIAHVCCSRNISYWAKSGTSFIYISIQSGHLWFLAAAGSKYVKCIAVHLHFYIGCDQISRLYFCIHLNARLDTQFLCRFYFPWRKRRWGIALLSIMMLIMVLLL